MKLSTGVGSHMLRTLVLWLSWSFKHLRVEVTLTGEFPCLCFIWKDLERTAERGLTESIRAGCSAAFSIPGTGDAGGERLVIVLEVKEPQVRRWSLLMFVVDAP